MLDLLSCNDNPGKYPDSWYAASTETLPEFEPLTNNLRCDVVIIGGGYTGLSTALYLAQQGVSVTLLEANRVGWGASGRNGGQVGSGFNMNQTDIAAAIGDTSARALWDISENAKSTVRNLIETHEIDCDLSEGIAFASWKKRHKSALQKSIDTMAARYGYDKYSLIENDAVIKLTGSKVYPFAVVDHGAYHLHPLKFAIGLAAAAKKAGVVIHEKSKVVSIVDKGSVTVSTVQGKVVADHAVLACNGYLGSLDKSVSKQVLPINNFMVATEPLDHLSEADQILPGRVSLFDSKFVVNYFRLSSDNRLLFGGGESYGYQFPNDIKSIVRKPLTKIYPQLKNVRIDYAWGGTLGITVNRMPRFQHSSPHVLSAGGYSGHGVALASYSGQVIGKAILGDSSEFDHLAKVPSRPFPGGQLLREPIQRAAMAFGALIDRLP